jgi:2-polyprenyl-3-methyl-5-hydroxy-6-metoxy-1,4-benzoquinol methylase
MTQIAATSVQQRFWNAWNADHREKPHYASLRQAEVVCQWVRSLARTNLDIIEVGCGTGWFCSTLSRFGTVKGTDLSDECLARAARGSPEVTFVPGDFMALDFGQAAYDVVVTLEVLSHVADQSTFIQKVASHLRPGGLLMMATQNRRVLEKFNRIPAPMPGQLRRWVDRHELRALLNHEFEILELFSVSRRANRGIMRLINSHKLNWPVRALVGDRVERFKERMGLGWTLMALARKRG